MSKTPGSTIIPGLRYRDAPAMIEWLCRAFGFAKHAVFANPDGTIAHAQLSCSLSSLWTCAIFLVAPRR
jgi:uncharacterized glyoxalase superfamily protein PhnB